MQVTLSRIVLDDVEHRTLIMSDISSLARAQRENRSKDEFLAMLAHELRNPLGAIQGAVHALGIIGHSDPMALRATGIIKRQVLHMARLVDDLLDVGRAVTGKIVLKRAAVNLADMREVVGVDHRLGQRQPRTHRPGVRTLLGERRRGAARTDRRQPGVECAQVLAGRTHRRACSSGVKATMPWCASRTRASASRRKCCRRSSTCSCRRITPSTARAAVSVSVSRW